MEKVRITFQPEGKTAELPLGGSVLEATEPLELYITSPCGAGGRCGRCRVRLLDGSIPYDPLELKLLRPEERERGIRLACCLKPSHDVVVELLPEYVYVQPRAKLEIEGPAVEVESGLEKHLVPLKAPTLEDQVSLLHQILRSLPPRDEGYRTDLEAVKALQMIPWQDGEVATATIRDGTIIALERGDTRRAQYGLAVDIGTTTIACFLVDLVTGETLGAAAKANSQRFFGDDVVSRIKYAMEKEEGLGRLHRRLIRDINTLLTSTCREAGIPPDRVYRMVFVGNATMLHLFLGLDPRSLGTAPYVPLADEGIELRADDLGIVANPSCRCSLLPSIASWVGSDALAMTLAAGIDQRDGIVLAIDVGTNGESILGWRKEILCCSNAAGPAFEGAHIADGMQAFPGAIEAVWIEGDVHLKTIGGFPPKGLCGSGLIDAVAALLDVGLIEPSGRMLGREEAKERLPHLGSPILNRLRREGSQNTFVLATEEESETGLPIRLTQSDVRELQMASGAIAAGCRLLMREMGIEEQEISEVLLAGSFGNHIRAKSAIRIGLIPRLPSGKVHFIGNAAGAGARMALLSHSTSRRAEALRKKIRYVEQAGRPDFQDLLMEAIIFPGL